MNDILPYSYEFIVTMVLGSSQQISSFSLNRIFELNLVAVKLVQEKDLVNWLWSCHAATVVDPSHIEMVVYMINKFPELPTYHTGKFFNCK